MGKTVLAVVGVAVAIGIAIAAPYLAPIVLGALAIAATATSVAVATALIAVTLSIAASIAFRAIGIGTPQAKGQTGPPAVFRQSIIDSFIVYGKRRVGGLMVFFHSLQGATGAHWRYFVIACAGHRCQGVVSWMLNDEVVTVDGSNMVTSGKYANNAWLWFQRGLASETANATFVAECGGKWTTAHKGNGVAAIYAKFKLTDDTIEAGMPNITAIIEGRDEILDVRTGVTGYTRNAELIFYDWMQIPREEGGFGAYPDEVPLASFIAANANVCDETVNGAPRYAFDAVLTTGSAPAEVRDAFVVNCAGRYTFSGGKHLMRPGYWVPVTASLSEDDLAGPIQISPFLPSDQAANQVQGTYISPNANYQGAPFTTQSRPAADVRQFDLDLAFTTNKDQADRVARIMLNRAGAEKQVVWPMNIKGLGIRALDTVQLDTSRYSLSNYAFFVGNWALSAEFGVVLSVAEENAEIYDGPGVVAPPSPPTIVQPPGPVTLLADIQRALRNTYPSGLTVDSIDAGSNATIRLYGTTTSNPFAIDYPGTTTDPSVGPISLTGKSYSTVYYLYADIDPTVGVGDPAPTFGATTVFADSLNSSTNPYRIALGRVITTAASGGGTTTGSGTGGGGYSGGGSGGGGVRP